MDELKRLIDEREVVQRQVDLFSGKYKQRNTVWHKTLERIDKRIEDLTQEQDLAEEKELDNG